LLDNELESLAYLLGVSDVLPIEAEAGDGDEPAPPSARKSDKETLLNNVTGLMIRL